jgi:signal transduction histidine kinase
MLDFYRPGSAKSEQLHVGELLHYIINLTDKQLNERGIAISTEVPEELPAIEAVSSQLQQVFMNLILNSYDAMPGGGELRITGREANGGVEVLFQDSGPGISQEHARSVFEPFFSTKEGGSGLGLTISYNIIAAHGGSLDLMPNGGTGACFRVFLPRERAHEVEHPDR